MAAKTESHIRVAAVHAAPVFMNKDATIDKVLKCISDRGSSVDYLVFPEVFVPGYPALIEEGQIIHAGAWPALSTMKGFEAVADAQIEALIKNHALTGQCFVVCASNYIDESCLRWMEENLGPQELVKRGGGWSAVIHPFCSFLAGPVKGDGRGDTLVEAVIDQRELGQVKVWIDANGHYKRPEILKLEVCRRALWADDEIAAESRKYDQGRKV
ncbi:hypothetical protein DL764_008837 [Monosporascus ibericus]|uniref:CN hydrolase domain-containing protein n=1 Tax=Monosporascus ibericus TaxID=155417 RepID=A0A4Q4SWI0_9PEZI|nr:hypothetical protein DL764_008837 [Monosporascus ibericus]